MGKMRERLAAYDRTLTVKKRLSVSNIVMFAVPVIVTLFCAAAPFGRSRSLWAC